MAAYIDETIEPFRLMIDGVEQIFDIMDPELPEWVESGAMASGGYPYERRLKRRDYDEELEALQIELVKLQKWLKENGQRILAVFEGRDAAGKGGTIFNLRRYLNPRTARNVALAKPTETERGQWYFQRYVTHFPTTGEFVTFDRSWYNRAGVEPVMGFCTPEQHKAFLKEVPSFEEAIVEDGIIFQKFWLNIGREMQLKRFHDRVHSPLKFWKFSPIDVAGIEKWEEYTRNRDIMFERCDTAHAPWTIVRSNDKRRARLAVIRKILSAVPYDNCNRDVVGKRDANIIVGRDEVMAR